MENIKAIFFDIDGTLQTIEETPRIPESTRLAWDLLRKNGIKLFIATGRPEYNLAAFKSLSNYEFDGWVILNGQHVYSKDTIIRSVQIPKDEMKEAMQFLKEHHILCSFASVNTMYSNGEGDHPFMEGVEIATEEEILNMDIYQLMLFIPEEEKELEDQFFEILKSCKSARWTPIFADVIPKDGGKNRGIDAMLDYFNIPLEQSMGFGDGGNDISMLEHVHLGVAMGNARDHVKEKADYVTTNIEDDGIYNACKHFGLI